MLYLSSKGEFLNVPMFELRNNLVKFRGIIPNPWWYEIAPPLERTKFTGRLAKIAAPNGHAVDEKATCRVLKNTIVILLRLEIFLRHNFNNYLQRFLKVAGHM